MKTIDRRLCRLERKFTPEVDHESRRLADMIRERRHRRLEASGLPFEERPDLSLYELGRRPTLAETIRHCRAQRRAQGEARRAERAEQVG